MKTTMPPTIHGLTVYEKMIAEATGAPDAILPILENIRASGDANAIGTATEALAEAKGEEAEALQAFDNYLGLGV